jgi:hypothetical protein
MELSYQFIFSSYHTVSGQQINIFFRPPSGATGGYVLTIGLFMLSNRLAATRLTAARFDRSGAGAANPNRPPPRTL